MNFPHVIPKATRDVYGPSDEVILANLKRKIRSEHFDYGPQTLRSICLNAIGENYNSLAPISGISAEDSNYLIEILATDAELGLVMDVKDDFYWRRRCEDTWPKRVFEVKDDVEYWKRLYCSKHLQDLIEGADDDQDILAETLVIERCVYELTIEKLNEIKGEGRGLPPARGNVDHLPLGILLHNLSNLVELRLSFHIDPDGCLFELSSSDWRSITEHLPDLVNLRRWRVSKCRTSATKMRMLAKCLLSMRLEVFEMSLCLLDDDAIKIISYVILNNENLKTIILADNEFGDEGLHALSYAMLKAKTPLEVIDLRRNMISELGASYLASALVHCRQGPKEINLSCCDLKGASACWIAGALKFNTSLEKVSVAVNNFSGEAMEVLLDSLHVNSKLTKIDIKETEVSESQRLKLEGVMLNSKKLKVVG